jgi:hypothetical protein
VRIRWLLVAAITATAAACSSPGPATVVDARVPAPVDGTWDLTWSCLSCEPGDVNPLQYATTLTVTDGSLVYAGDACKGCGATHTGTENNPGTCVDVPAGTVVDELSWDAYTLCAFVDGINGQITFTGYPGPPDARTYWLSGDPP